MDKLSYLLRLADQDASEKTERVLDTWSALGELKVSKRTKYYQAGTLVRVDCSPAGDGGQSKSPLHNAILYVQENYQVDGRDKFEIDWAAMKPDDIDGMLVSVEGVSLPYFVIMPGIKWNGSFVPDAKFVPFLTDEGSTVEAVVNIDDNELMLCLSDLGMPFLTFRELEYNRNEIVNVCVKPAMDRYFTFMPIIREQGNFGQYTSGAPFKIEMPKDAYSAVPYYCSGIGGGVGGNAGSPFSYFQEQMLWGAGAGYGMGSSRFGKGISYFNKQQPGFTGVVGRWASRMDNNAIAQALKNYMRMEKFHIIKENGKRFVTGFSTIGGQLNILWLCTSRDWDDVKFEHLTDIARPLVKIEALRAINFLRKLVKGDIPGAIEADSFLARADKLEEQVNKLIGSITTGYSLALMRSGGGQ